jgi:hypothetical protein
MVAENSVNPLVGQSILEILSTYEATGWRTDSAALDALAAVEGPDDVSAIRGVIRTIYKPWLESCAVALQKMVAAETYTAANPPTLDDGTCLVFSDGLRYDLGQRLKAALEALGLNCVLTAGLAALPSITATSKPAISPARDRFTGRGSVGLEPIVKSSGTRVTVDVLRRALTSEGVQVLSGDDLGDPSGTAWKELGDIDSLGHEHGWRLAHHLTVELRRLETCVRDLLSHGWQRVVLITDHGWLLMPGGLPRADLPEHLTEVRKGRCARLKPGSAVDQQVVAWHWDDSVRFAMAPGIACFEAGKEYEHGGLSPQECVTPVLIVSKRHSGPAAAVQFKSLAWTQQRCRVSTSGAPEGASIDIRFQPADANSSIVGGGRPLDPEGRASLLVEDENIAGREVYVVLLSAGGMLLEQRETTVGASLD